MLLLTLSPYRLAWVRLGLGYPAPPGAVMPQHNEIVLLARRVVGPHGTEHRIGWAMRATALKHPPWSPWRGRTRWLISRVACWKLARPFRLEGIQLTPTDYSAGLSVQRLEGQDAGEVYRRKLLQGAEEVVTFEREPATPEDDALRGLFHTLWSRAAWHDDYLKSEWKELAGMLERRGVFKYPARTGKAG